MQWDKRMPLVMSQEHHDTMLTAEAEIRLNHGIVHGLLPVLYNNVENVLRSYMLGREPSKGDLLELRKMLPDWCSTSICNNPKDTMWHD